MKKRFGRRQHYSLIQPMVFSLFPGHALSIAASTPGEREMLSAIKNIEGWLSDEVALLLYRLTGKCFTLGPVVEIGSWQGKSTLAMALALSQKSPRPKGEWLPRVIAVDPHTGSQEHRHLAQHRSCNSLPAFQHNIHQHRVETWVEPMVMTSKKASEIVAGPISGLFIDGSHERQDVETDFHSWFSKLAPGGWIAFHDSKWPGVRETLWQELYPHPNVGIIRRIEDTTFAFKLGDPKRMAYFCNYFRLRSLQASQSLKRRRRKLQKSWRRLRET